MLNIACCLMLNDLTVSAVMAQTSNTYTKCLQVGTTSYNKNMFLNSDCISAIDCAMMCIEVGKCTAFTYDDLTKTCRLNQKIDTINCDLNKEDGGITFTKETKCPIDWKKLENSFYYYENTTELSWDDATEYCVSHGGYLAEVTDEAEFKLVDSIINADAYIGCRHFNGKWQWTTSGKELALTDTLWYPGESKNWKCTQIWKGHKLDDTLCFVPKYFLCAKAILFV